METVGIGAGTQVAICLTLPTTFDSVASTGYPSLTYLDIAKVTNFTPGGLVWGETISEPIDSDEEDVYKSIKRYGSDSLTVDRDDDDVGQAAIRTALVTRNKAAIRVTNPDTSVDYYPALVMSAPDSGITSAGMRARSVALRRTGGEVNVAAA